MPGELTVPAATLRRAVQRRADETSVRATALEIGLSRSGLAQFLRGAAPYAPTLEKLRAWYARTEAGPTLTPTRARAVLASLVESLPPERREEVVGEVVALLVERHRAAGVRVPDWLGRIRKG